MQSCGISPDLIVRLDDKSGVEESHLLKPSYSRRVVTFRKHRLRTIGLKIQQMPRPEKASH